MRNDSSGIPRNPSDIDHELQSAVIMMIDDEPISLEMVKAYLEEAGFSNFIQIAESTEALAAAEKNKPDILLLDLMMPEVSGYDVLTQLRKHPVLSHLPVIILTAASDAESKLRALDLGATDFLAKPVDPSELVLRLRNTLAAKAYLDQLAYYDPITNLPNRKMFHELFHSTLEKAKRYNEKFALLNIEVDNFDRISDTIGLGAGDEVLRQITHRLENAVRDVDLLGHSMIKDDTVVDLFRIEGPVFSLLLYRINEATNSAKVSKRLLEEIRKPVPYEGNDIYVTGSIGITAYPAEAQEYGELLRLASTAKDYAKNRGGDTFQFSSSAINEAYENRNRLEYKLRKAMANDELVLFYQPKVNVATNVIDGLEALVRWDSDDGFFLPGDFIAMAEETGLIIPFGDWILKEACTRLKKLHENGSNGLSMAVNLSAKQFAAPDFFAKVERIISQTGIDPRYLKLELTESLLLDDIDSKISLLQNLKDIGLKISVDDFGTGYSSLSYLSKLPLDELKIDKSFIDNVTDNADSRAIVSTIIFLARKLGLQTVAEGIETKEQLKYLEQEGCDLYQGFLFSKPVPSAELPQLLASVNK